jgi:dCMP deaminase
MTHVQPLPRPSRDDYYMGIALAVRRRANCLGSRVGAILVLDDRIIATGYNGTPAGFTNCDQGGCDRCKNRHHYVSGEAYDLCVCVHAEQNAILTAARFGIAVAGATCYTTTRPCYGCSKELLQAQVVGVRFLHDWSHPKESLRKAYESLQDHFPQKVLNVPVEDPDAEWAVSAKRLKESVKADPDQVP